ncbi:hypothetical protein EXE58_04995 [Nocardioides seonyuensis]|uniref:Uncharacterized protein n=1 Tax=Nocardioides seonyuensis TaxID=2518371 RepID=A0A4V1BM24_9ACTN|nr:hypothetical protein [Nocardioides seonyuensis]QBX54882.1 hypothetical protein EXE58_04995 [Nocardioides seonyuensis]
MPHPGPRRARELWLLLEPIHAVTYFSPEPLAALKHAGYRGFWMGYFAGRAAPLGPVSAELVHALFYNFAFEHVSRALPDAWAFAPPGAALEAREAGSVAALTRHLGDLAQAPAVARAAEIASAAASSAPMEGRPLFAANRTIPEPEKPLARLWHAATLLREHRGDAHVAALVAAGISGRESHVLHALHSGTSEEVYVTARNLGAEEWRSILDRLQERGLVAGSGGLTESGAATKQTIEDRTDALAWTAFDHLGEARVDELLGALRPITAAVVAAGEIPTHSPMGLDLTDSAAARAPAPSG